ncbi:MAG TPA: LysR substrate-binding domain-containing protein [Polyangiales bacterium]|nr:LysR substrate-binding domain-containing protein [Polyangiales bacterium]
MNLNHLRVFASVAEHGNLTRAARELNVSQPAISKQLSDLEEDLGTQLVDRLPRGVRLTQAGEVLFTHAQRILQAERAAQQDLRDLRGLGRGKLSVGASTTVGSYLVPSLMGELHRQHPGVQLDLSIANTAAVQSAVLENRCDVGLIEGFVTSESLAVETLIADDMVGIAAPAHPVLARGPLRAASLAELPLLMREQGSGSREVVEAALRKRNLDIKPVMSLGSTEAIKSAVIHGLGIAFVSRLTVEHELQSKRLVELSFNDLQIRRDLYLVALRGKRHSAAASAFIALTRRRLRSARAQNPGDAYMI